ncbi:hypothetical protein VARIO8X_90276 [Burkholderiales bacterium 8X]|nr:hypothetical protein VARIO8X_90276 [Burkholderiales bacterium 8X]
MHAFPFMTEHGPWFLFSESESYPKDQTADELRDRLGRVKVWLDDAEFREFRNIPAFRNDLTAVAQWAHREILDCAGWAVLNHWRLPEAVQKYREAIVEREISNVFDYSGEVGLIDSEPAKVDKIRSYMKSVPTPILREKAKAMCWCVKTWIASVALESLQSRSLPSMHGPAEIRSIYQRLRTCGAEVMELEFFLGCAMSKRTRVIQWALLYGCAFGRADSETFLSALAALASSEQGVEWLLQLASDYEAAYSKFGLKSGLDPETVLVVLGLLKSIPTDAAPRDSAELAALVDEQTRLHQQGSAVRRDVAVMETLEMLVDHQIRLPRDRAADAEAVLAFFYAQNVRIANDALESRPSGREDELSGPATRGRGGRGRQPQGRGHSRSSPLASEETTRSTRAAWSIDQYVEWIEGPVASKSRKPMNAEAAAKAYNAQVQARHEEELRALGSQPGSSGARRALDKPSVMDTREAERIIQEALHQTLDFIDGSIADLLALEGKDGILFDVSELENDRKKLQALKSQPSMDESAARACFHDAWTRIETLRAAIESERMARPPQLSEQVYRNFKQAFWKTLEKEELALGNHAGGKVLIEADPMRYWARIARELHGRLVILPNAQHVIRQDQQRNHALALYVTLGSCTKDVSFCISVHRWRRNPGSTAPPADPETMMMDRANWIDTLDACCVLHVMSAALASKGERAESTVTSSKSAH